MSKRVQRRACQAHHRDVKAKALPPGPRDDPPPWGSALSPSFSSSAWGWGKSCHSPAALQECCEGAQDNISKPRATMPHGGISIKIFITFLWPSPVVPRDSCSLTFLSASGKLSASLICFPFKPLYLFRLSWASKQIFPPMPTFHLT